MIQLKFKNESSSRIPLGASAVNLKDYLVSMGETEIVARANAWRLKAVVGDVNITTNGVEAGASSGTPIQNGSFYQASIAKAEDVWFFSPTGASEVSIEPKISMTHTLEDIPKAVSGVTPPYSPPTFSSFLINGQSSFLEVGESVVGGVRQFDWTTSNSGNIQANSLEITDVTTPSVLGTGLANDGTENLNIGGAIALTSEGYHVWRITGTNTQAVNFSRDFTVNWQRRVYFGENVDTPLNETEIKSLRATLLSDTAERVYDFVADSGKYKYICYPSAWGTLTNFINTANNFAVPFDTVYTVSVTNDFGITENYNVHRTFYQLGGAISISATY